MCFNSSNSEKSECSTNPKLDPFIDMSDHVAVEYPSKSEIFFLVFLLTSGHVLEENVSFISEMIPYR